MKSLEKQTNEIERLQKQSLPNIYSPNNQINQLLLYIFTGFFFLMLFDNIYKLGKKSY